MIAHQKINKLTTLTSKQNCHYTMRTLDGKVINIWHNKSVQAKEKYEKEIGVAKCISEQFKKERNARYP